MHVEGEVTGRPVGQRGTQHIYIHDSGAPISAIQQPKANKQHKQIGPPCQRPPRWSGGRPGRPSAHFEPAQWRPRQKTRAHTHAQVGTREARVLRVYCLYGRGHVQRHSTSWAAWRC
eukprot:scaffold24805_cov157-Isochrysis_galbana.AAC.1